MVKALDVYFHNKLAGRLEQDVHGEMNFIYSTDWLNSPDAMKISCSLPLHQSTFKKKECQAFFGGILPEDHQRKIIARNLGISANNDFSMLEKLGGECAGALTFIKSGEPLNQQNENYQELTGSLLPNMLRELPAKPLLAGKEGVRLSLAGVQDKIAVYIKNDRIFIPLNNAPSTHILKPDFSPYEGVIFNEAFCLDLARKIGLTVAEAEIKKAENINYLLVKRYDRINDEINKSITRVHQEDFCQALGVLSTHKYQNEGGPSLKQCFDLLRIESSVPVMDLDKMTSAVIFNFLIGNCDAHGKNFSLLYLAELQLAPLYDLISTVYYQELDKKMAMKLGGQYQIDRVTLSNFDIFANEAGLAKAELKNRIKKIIDAILACLPRMEIHDKTQSDVAELIRKRCEHFFSRLTSRQ